MTCDAMCVCAPSIRSLFFSHRVLFHTPSIKFQSKFSVRFTFNVIGSPLFRYDYGHNYVQIWSLRFFISLSIFQLVYYHDGWLLRHLCLSFKHTHIHNFYIVVLGVYVVLSKMILSQNIAYVNVKHRNE